MRPLRTAVRRVLGAAAGLTALGAAFAAGVVAGAGSAVPAASPAGVLDEAAAQIAATSLQPVDRAALEAAAVDGMLDAAGDPWGSRAGAGASGTGLWLRRAADGTVEVARVSAGSPAATAGVRVGEQVRGVDDASVRGLPAARVAALLRGPAGTEVHVTLSRGAALRTVVLRRAAAPVAQVEATAREGVARVAVSGFEQGTGRRVREALAALRVQAPRGVLLDLRGNPGGRLDEAVEVASVFLDGGPVVSYTRNDGGTRALRALAAGDTTTPLVVLVDGGTASAAEVVAAALQDRGRAVLVGAHTYGKGTVQEPRALGDGSSLELTVARWTTPSGRSLDGTGLAPDIEVAAGTAPAVAERRAVEVLRGLRAGAGGRG